MIKGRAAKMGMESSMGAIKPIIFESQNESSNNYTKLIFIDLDYGLNLSVSMSSLLDH